NQGLAKSQGIFIQEYQSSCVDFDKELEQYLAGETSTEDFQKAVRESYLPRMKSLQNTCDTMSKRTADSIPCMNELRQIIDLKTELAGIMLEKPFLSRADMPQDIREIFKKISSLEKTVQEKCSQTNE
ncbi:MAG: hypothetical protein J6X55_06815, partial [Victivallales bacterium]|nr:hypothetical protein [Victivallales bacterium]